MSVEEGGTGGGVTQGGQPTKLAGGSSRSDDWVKAWGKLHPPIFSGNGKPEAAPGAIDLNLARGMGYIGIHHVRELMTTIRIKQT
jgi:hypothetical protein